MLLSIVLSAFYFVCLYELILANQNALSYGDGCRLQTPVTRHQEQMWNQLLDHQTATVVRQKTHHNSFQRWFVLHTLSIF